MTTCHPAWLRRAMASSAPGRGIHSSGDLMNSSLSALMVPSRSRMTSFMASGLCGAAPRPVGDGLYRVPGRVQLGDPLQQSVDFDHPVTQQGTNEVRILLARRHALRYGQVMNLGADGRHVAHVKELRAALPVR